MYTCVYLCTCSTLIERERRIMVVPLNKKFGLQVPDRMLVCTVFVVFQACARKLICGPVIAPGLHVRMCTLEHVSRGQKQACFAPETT